MKHTHTLLLTASMLFSIGTFCQSPAKDPETERLLLSQFDKMVAAFLQDDMPGVTKFYADDAVMASGRSEVKGRKNMDSYWATLKGKGKDWKLTTNYIEVYNNIALHDGISVLTYVDGGKELISKTRFLVVWRKQQDGSWKIIKDYYSGY